MSPLLRLALPALALASTAFAASCDSDVTIQNAGDASSLASCDDDTFQGTITIDSKATDDLNMAGLTEIKGDLVLESNLALKRLSASDLETITGELRINDVQNLVSLSFPKLTKVDQITLTGLPNLRQLDFTAGVTNASTLRVENTKLDNLKGINLYMAKTIVVAGNDGISELSMQTTNITERVEISHNNDDLDVKLPNLKSANNATFRACASIDLSSLEQINKGSLGIYESKNLETFIAPNLTKIDGAFTIANNDNLNNVTLPKLETVNDNFQIANNTNLSELEGSFEALKTVRGAFDISGNITSISTPNLNLVVGVFNLQSTGNISQICSEFYDPLNKKKKLGPTNKYTCRGDLDQAQTAGNKPKGSSNSDSGAASVMNAQSIMHVALVALIAVFLA